jgi:PEP-CTERM motif
MRKLLLSTALCVLASAANAQLFTPDGKFTVTLVNSPTSETDTVTLTPGVAQTLAGGDLDLTISIVPVSRGAEWLVFDYQTTSPSIPLSTAAQNWSIEQIGLPAAQAVNFIGDYTQWTSASGANIPQTGRIFGQTLESNPIPGFTGQGEGNSGFIDHIGGPGPLPQLGGFADPFNIVLMGLPASQVNGELAGLEFAPNGAAPPSAIPEPSTWAMLGIGFGMMAFFGMRKRVLA